MARQQTKLRYPRRRFARGLTRLAGRILLPLLFRVKVSGRENLPRKGPLLVVGNHTAAMEVVLLYILSPWQVEFLSSADIPPEPIIAMLSRWIGVIDLHRGHFDRSALNSALDILDQDGVIGLFPEGGIWQKGEKKAQSGVAWLSFRGQAPVLPIGFSDTKGMLNQALKLKRPIIKMNIGQPLPPANHPGTRSRKEFFQAYAGEVMSAVNQLVPPEDLRRGPLIQDERFSLEMRYFKNGGESDQRPVDFNLEEAQALAKFLHRPAILKIFRRNLAMNIQALESLDEHPDPAEITAALDAILHYLEAENPYLLAYRFGSQEGANMIRGLKKLRSVAEWAEEQEIKLHIIPIRKYYSPAEETEIIQIKQGTFDSWM